VLGFFRIGGHAVLQLQRRLVMRDGQVGRAYFCFQFVALLQAAVLHDLLAEQLKAFIQPSQMFSDASFHAKKTPYVRIQLK
jgi:hypothetical protein